MPAFGGPNSIGGAKGLLTRLGQGLGRDITKKGADKLLSSSDDKPSAGPHAPIEIPQQVTQEANWKSVDLGGKHQVAMNLPPIKPPSLHAIARTSLYPNTILKNAKPTPNPIATPLAITSLDNIKQGKLPSTKAEPGISSKN